MISKKKKISRYLESVDQEARTAFDVLLGDYLSGALHDALAALGIKKISCRVDFRNDYKCIDVQGRYRSCYFDLQIEPAEFGIGCDPVEPDGHRYFPLESPEEMYSVISSELRSLNNE